VVENECIDILEDDFFARELCVIHWCRISAAGEGEVGVEVKVGVIGVMGIAVVFSIGGRTSSKFRSCRASPKM